MNESSNLYLLIEQFLKQILIQSIQKHYCMNQNIQSICDNLQFSIEITKDKSHGDIATNIAMIFAAKMRNNSHINSKQNNTDKEKIFADPKEVAQQIIYEIEHFKKKDHILISNTNDTMQNYKTMHKYIKKVHVAGPGFINLIMHSQFWQNFLKSTNEAGIEYGLVNLGKGEKINLEFVSANPTGPMHVGHARGAIYGDTLARLLEVTGYEVEREYLINDAGRQVDILSLSLWIRYQQCCGVSVELPEGCYPGSYLSSIAQKLKEEKGQDLLKNSYENTKDFLKNFAIEQIMRMIKEDLKSLDVKFDLFSSEQKDVIDKGKVEEAIDYLRSNDLIYSGILEQPKGKLTDDWEPREQLLFRSTAFGDDLDRAIIKADGSYTYMTPDMAYHKTKIDRGCTKLITLLGADHVGYVKRICSAVKALSDNKTDMEVIIMQLVNLLDNGVPIKMSKRAGKFLTLKDAIQELGKDILRFIMLMRKGDTVLDLDFTKAKEQSKDNPAFYVQYAHTRACSIIRKAISAKIIQKNEINIDYQSVDCDLHSLDKQIEYTYSPQFSIAYSLLTEESDIALIKQIALLPKILEGAARNYEPHRIVYYLQDLSAVFHSIWNLGFSETRLRFILQDCDNDNIELSRARIALVYATAKTIGICLTIIGIKPMIEM